MKNTNSFYEIAVKTNMFLVMIEKWISLFPEVASKMIDETKIAIESALENPKDAILNDIDKFIGDEANDYHTLKNRLDEKITCVYTKAESLDILRRLKNGEDPELLLKYKAIIKYLEDKGKTITFTRDSETFRINGVNVTDK